MCGIVGFASNDDIRKKLLSSLRHLEYRGYDRGVKVIFAAAGATGMGAITEAKTRVVNGEEVTMTYQQWSQSMMGTGKFANADFKTKLAITAQLEEIYLKFYYRIPLCATTVCTLLSYQINYYTEDYNIMYGFGGLRLMTYNYNDADWAAYVKSEGGTLNYN